jgi:enamine deaminase RidA (YjgF/YER057c/UK114 family)
MTDAGAGSPAATTPRPLDVPGLAPSGPGWSQVTIAAGLVFVSGQVAFDEHGEIVGRGSVEAQAHQVFTNVETALAAAGSGMDRVARLTVYLTDADHIAAFRDVRRYRLAARPASTFLVVSALVDPDLLVEIDAIATL